MSELPTNFLPRVSQNNGGKLALIIMIVHGSNSNCWSLLITVASNLWLRTRHISSRVGAAVSSSVNQPAWGRHWRCASARAYDFVAFVASFDHFQLPMCTTPFPNCFLVSFPNFKKPCSISHQFWEIWLTPNRVFTLRKHIFHTTEKIICKWVPSPPPQFFKIDVHPIRDIFPPSPTRFTWFFVLPLNDSQL